MRRTTMLLSLAAFVPLSCATPRAGEPATAGREAAKAAAATPVPAPAPAPAPTTTDGRAEIRYYVIGDT